MEGGWMGGIDGGGMERGGTDGGGVTRRDCPGPDCCSLHCSYHILVMCPCHHILVVFAWVICHSAVFMVGGRCVIHSCVWASIHIHFCGWSSSLYGGHGLVLALGISVLAVVVWP